MIPDHEGARRAMAAEQLAARGIRDARILEAFGRVPRHLFVREADTDLACADRPLPIACGQTISQPYIVARTLELLELRPGTRVLEIGTGSGYQTALLAELGCEVWTIERHAALAREAQARLDALGYGGVRFRTGDGTLGWPEAAPFEAIAVSAAAPAVPAAYREQLEEGGRLVIPVGSGDAQRLVLVRRTPSGFETTDAGGVVFVRLIGEQGWPS
ncbi:MAG: protein-L-isoaspartate(D-aspartate) O-methyltransferase [Candidatus Brocadiae bacterium]|nr:protein-L-isoaspartate(D-aspartate) O-methyltransferase [Candidatus Brocadiia bacterium]